MKSKDTFIKEIISDIYNLPSPQLDESRRNQISEIINVVINGDIVSEYFVSDVIINKKLGVYVYILTDNRLVIVTIDTQDKINTYPFLIRELQKLFFNSPEPNTISVEIRLSNNEVIGLKYRADNEKITSFFQALDQVLIKQSQEYGKK
jgi:hypothetical protein